MSKDTVLIRFVGHAGIRKLGDYLWGPANDHVYPVDLETAANLLTYPRPDFHLVKNQEMSPALQAKLADLIGIKTAEIESLVEVVETAAVNPPELTDIDGIGDGRAEELVDQGIETVADLAAQDDAGIERLAANTGASRGQIRAWVKQAKQLTEASNG